MEFQWQEYARRPIARGQDRVYATISRKGKIYLNDRALRALGDPESILLFYDNRRSTMGIRRAPAGSPNAFRLKANTTAGRGRVIYAADFCRAFSYKPERNACIPRSPGEQ